jgi:hypothetical protein
MVEREPRKETLRKGELLYLGHLETQNLFSGYGLTEQEGSKEKPSGLLMVDWPRPADPTWLREVEATYGRYRLIPMTTSGERGIACQMRVELESQDLFSIK